MSSSKKEDEMSESSHARTSKRVSRSEGLSASFHDTSKKRGGSSSPSPSRKTATSLSPVRKSAIRRHGTYAGPDHAAGGGPPKISPFLTGKKHHAKKRVGVASKPQIASAEDQAVSTTCTSVPTSTAAMGKIYDEEDDIAPLPFTTFQRAPTSGYVDNQRHSRGSGSGSSSGGGAMRRLSNMIVNFTTGNRNDSHNVSQLSLDPELNEQTTEKKNLGSTTLAERGDMFQVDQSVNLMDARAGHYASTGSNSTGATAAGGARSGRLRRNRSKQTRPSIMEAMFGRQSMVDVVLGPDPTKRQASQKQFTTKSAPYEGFCDALGFYGSLICSGPFLLFIALIVTVAIILPILTTAENRDMTATATRLAALNTTMEPTVIPTMTVAPSHSPSIRGSNPPTLSPTTPPLSESQGLATRTTVNSNSIHHHHHTQKNQTQIVPSKIFVLSVGSGPKIPDSSSAGPET